MERYVLFLIVLIVIPVPAEAESLFDKYCLVEDSLARYPIPKAGETVDGTQKTWFTTPFDLKPGKFSMNCKGLEEVTEDSFTVTPMSVVGKFTYRFTLKGKEPAGDKQIPTRKLLSMKQLRFDQLLNVKDRNVLIGCNVNKVLPDGRKFQCTIPMASGELPFHVDVIAQKDVGRIPQVLSRQYGPHAQHVFDIYYPEDFKPGVDKPLPMYVMIHGGGWGALDKRNKRIGSDATVWNEKGIAFVSINYRYVSAFESHPRMKIPVAASLLDAARCIQYIRYHAKKLGLDTTRMCLTGGSAGGATSSWLAMVDDLADPDSPDPVARMSTRVTCSTPLQAQTSLDPKQMRRWIPSITYGAHAFFSGSELPKDKAQRFEIWLSRRDEVMPYIKDFSAYHQASSDDPPMLLVYGGQEDVIPAKDRGNATHHPKFGEYLQKRLTELGVESYYWADNVRCEERRYNGWSGVAHFVCDKLLDTDR